MFTGIVEETGQVVALLKRAGGYSLEVRCSKVLEGIDIGDSVAVNGACLSVVRIKDKSVVFDIVENTWKVTGLKRARAASRVNLERALRSGDKISGHIVSGHIDCERRLKRNGRDGTGWVIDVELHSEDAVHIVEKGSVALDGVSLTVGEIRKGYFRVFIIPYTLENTILAKKKPGEKVNVEFDVLGKYVRKERKEQGITLEGLSENGFF